MQDKKRQVLTTLISSLLSQTGPSTLTGTLLSQTGSLTLSIAFPEGTTDPGQFLSRTRLSTLALRCWVEQGCWPWPVHCWFEPDHQPWLVRCWVRPGCWPWLVYSWAGSDHQYFCLVVMMWIEPAAQWVLWLSSLVQLWSFGIELCKWAEALWMFEQK